MRLRQTRAGSAGALPARRRTGSSRACAARPDIGAARQPTRRGLIFGNAQRGFARKNGTGSLTDRQRGRQTARSIAWPHAEQEGVIMARLSRIACTRTLARFGVAALVSAGLLAGCALEWQNRRAAQEIARLSEPPGSVYLGWRVFQNRCAACHGAAGEGSANGPDLLPRVRAMDSRRFVNLVLKRYDWNQLAAQARGDGDALDALVEQILRRQEYPVEMPAWEGEPRVNAHLADLFAYLSARAFDSQGPGRPER